MALMEIDSFLTKFKNLWHAGYKASFNLKSENGKAIVTLTADLGYAPPPPAYRPPVQRPRHRGTAYQRRQERRRQAASTCSAAVEEESKQENISTVINVVPEVAGEATESVQNESEKVIAAEPTLESPDFECIFCDFRSNWHNGLKVHMARKHEKDKIEQLDGNDDLELDTDEKYHRTRHYWATGFLGSGYQNYLDANALLKEVNISEKDMEHEKA